MTLQVRSAEMGTLRPTRLRAALSPARPSRSGSGAQKRARSPPGNHPKRRCGVPAVVSGRGCSSHTWAAAMLALLQILFPVAGQEPFWASATPGHVTIGRHVLVSVAGSGFLIGAQDYECCFETTIVNPLIGEFESRRAPLTIKTEASAECTTPEWNLPATVAVLKVVKADAAIRKEGPMKTFRFLHALSSCEPSSGPSRGSQTVTIKGSGFDKRVDSVYTSKFTGPGGLHVSSGPCSVNVPAQALLCTTPKWPYPSSNTTVTVWTDDGLIGGSNLSYSFLPSCTSVSPDSSYAGETTNVSISGQGFRQGQLVKCSFNYLGSTENQSIAQHRHIGGGESIFYCPTPLWRLQGCANASDNCTRRAHVELEVSGTVVCSLNFTFLSEMTGIFPTKGIAAGGNPVTIAGRGFDTDQNYVCSVVCGGRVFESEPKKPANPSDLVCMLPGISTLPCQTNLRLYADGREDQQVFASDGATSFRFEHYWTTANAFASSTVGGSFLSIYGLFEQGNRYQCNFVDDTLNRSSHASIVSHDELSCLIPSWPKAGSCSLFIETSLGVKVSRTHVTNYLFTFTSYHWSSVNPKTATVLGDIKLTLSGKFGGLNDDFRCLLYAGNHRRDSKLVTLSTSNTTMTCLFPQWAPLLPSSVELRVYNGEIQVPSTWRHQLAIVEVWSLFYPQSGTSMGGLLLTVNGTGFLSERQYVCKFCRDQTLCVQSDTATYVSQNFLSCVTPEWPYDGGAVNFSIVSDHGPIAMAGAVGSGCIYQYIGQWKWVYPNVVKSPTGNSTDNSHIVMTGIGFARDACNCTFTALECDTASLCMTSTPMIYVSSSRLQCYPPPWPYNSSLKAVVAVNCSTGVNLVGPSAPFNRIMFTYSAMKEIYPLFGVAGGQDYNVTVPATDAKYCYRSDNCNTDAYTCTFQSWEDPQRIFAVGTTLSVSDDEIVCRAPVWNYSAPHLVKFELRDEKAGARVLVNYDTFSSSNFTFLPFVGGVSFSEPMWKCTGSCTCDANAGQNESVPCISGSKASNGHISGYGFDSGEKYLCSIILHTAVGRKVVQKVYVSRVFSVNLLECLIPPLPGDVVAQTAVIQVLNSNESKIHGHATISYRAEIEKIVIMQAFGHGCAVAEVTCPEADSFIDVYAFGLEPHAQYACRMRNQFGDYVDSELNQPVRPSLLLCRMPVWKYRESEVSISVIKQGSGTVASLSTSRLSLNMAAIVTEIQPRVIPAKGNKTLMMQGFGFNTEIVYNCMFQTKDGTTVLQVSADVGNTTSMACSVPALRTKMQVLYLHICKVNGDGINMASELASGRLVFEAQWISIDRVSASAAGRDMLNVKGYGFYPGAQSFACKMTMDSVRWASSEASVVDSDSLTCQVPKWSWQAGQVIFSIMFGTFEVPYVLESEGENTGGNTEKRTIFNFTYLPEWNLPYDQVAPVDGGTNITIVGSGFDPFELYHATFEVDAKANITCSDHCSVGCISSFGSTSGTISDGSGDGVNYTNDLDCEWLVASEGQISLSFSFFDLEPNWDFVYVETCSSASCDSNSRVQLAELHGGSDTSATYASSTGYLRVRFKTDYSETFEGFEANWSVLQEGRTSGSCSGDGYLFKTHSGAIDISPVIDGSTRDCIWWIAPPGAMSVNISFDPDFNIPAPKSLIVEECTYIAEDVARVNAINCVPWDNNQVN